MDKLKPSRPLEGDESKIPTDGNRVQASNSKKYRGNKPQNKLIPEPEAETDFQGRCTYLEGYVFDLWPRVSDKFSQTIK